MLLFLEVLSLITHTELGAWKEGASLVYIARPYLKTKRREKKTNSENERILG